MILINQMQKYHKDAIGVDANVEVELTQPHRPPLINVPIDLLLYLPKVCHPHRTIHESLALVLVLEQVRLEVRLSLTLSRLRGTIVGHLLILRLGMLNLSWFFVEKSISFRVSL